MTSEIFMGCFLNVERDWSNGLFTAQREDLNSLSISEVHIKRFKNQEVSHEEIPSFPYVDGIFKFQDSHHVCRVERSPKVNFEAG